jgi:nucleotide-binding universal stress UspA family protein
MFDRIIVPLDGSAFAEAALAPACDLAGRFSSRILLATAVEPLNLPPVHPRAAATATQAAAAGDEEETAERAEEMDAYLQEQVVRLREQGYAADMTLFIGAPGTGIAGAAELSHADLIVMATRLGWTLPQRGPHQSSVTLEVLAQSRTPILSCHLVPRSPLETSPKAPGAAIPELAGPDLPIVVPLDGSPFAEQALDTARALARAFGSYLVLVEALPPNTGEDGGQRETREYLARLQAKLESEGVSATTVVAEGVEINVIEHTWRENGAGLIVIASHGHSGHQQHTGAAQPESAATSPLVGSVAASILEELEVPTLVIQPAT